MMGVDLVPALGRDVVMSRSVLLKLKRSPESPTEARFFQKIQADGNGCWNWTGYVSDKGYGAFNDGGQRRPAHRVIFGWFYGPEVMEGLDIDHLCRNRRCVHPLHLEAVTHAENVRRGEVARVFGDRTHCKNGHEFTPDNTLPRSDCNGRICLTCRREATARYRARHIEQLRVDDRERARAKADAQNRPMRWPGRVHPRYRDEEQ